MDGLIHVQVNKKNILAFGLLFEIRIYVFHLKSFKNHTITQQGMIKKKDMP